MTTSDVIAGLALVFSLVAILIQQRNRRADSADAAKQRQEDRADNAKRRDEDKADAAQARAADRAEAEQRLLAERHVRVDNLRVDAARRLLVAARQAAGGALGAIPGMADPTPFEVLADLNAVLVLDRVLLDSELHARASGLSTSCSILLDAVAVPIANREEMRKQLLGHLDSVVGQVHALERETYERLRSPRALVVEAAKPVTQN